MEVLEKVLKVVAAVFMAVTATILLIDLFTNGSKML